MATTTKRYKLELNCLIEGENSTLIISAPCTVNIDQLRGLIHQEGELSTLHVHLLDITLWKVEINLEPLKGRLSKFKPEDHHQGIILDDSSQPLSDLWEENPSDQLLRVFASVHGRVKKRSTLLLPSIQKPQSHLPSLTYLPLLSKPLIFKHYAFFDNKTKYQQSIFFANYGDKTVLVKFCKTYCKEAHELLAVAGLAPKLHYCTRITEGPFMVVMDIVNGRDAYHEFKYHDLPGTVLKDVCSALKLLHSAGLIFGDLRRPNVMVVKVLKDNKDEWHGQLVNFDWSGPVDKTRYPSMLNGGIKWAYGVEAEAIIQKQHDWDMLEMLTHHIE